NFQKKIQKFCIVDTSYVYNQTTPSSYFQNDNEIEDNQCIEFKTNDCYNNTVELLQLSFVCKYWATTVIPNVELPFTINNKKDYQWFLKWYQFGILENNSKKWYQKLKKKKPKYPAIKFDMSQVYLNFTLAPDLVVPKEIQNIFLNGISNQSPLSSSSNSVSSKEGNNIQQLLLSSSTNLDSGSDNGDYDYNALNLINCTNINKPNDSNMVTNTNNNPSIVTTCANNGFSNSNNASSVVSPSLSPKLSNNHKHNKPSTDNIYGSLQNHTQIQRLKVKVSSIRAKETDILMDLMNKNSKMKYLEIDRSELSSYNTNGDIRNFDIALYETISNFPWKLHEVKIQMTLSGTPIYHLAALTNIKKLYIEFIPSPIGEGRCDWNNFESLLKNAPEIETLSIKDCNRVPFNHIFTVMQNNRSLTELDISENISSSSILTSSSANLLNLLNTGQLLNNPSGFNHPNHNHSNHTQSNNSHHNHNHNSGHTTHNSATINRVLASHIDEFPYLTLKEFLSKNNYIQSLSLSYTGIASPLLLNSNSTEFQLSSTSLQKLKLFKLNDKDKLNISFNIPSLKELVLLPYRNRGLILFLKGAKKIDRLTLYKQDSKPTKSCFEMDELFKNIMNNSHLKAFYNHFYLPQTNAIDLIKKNHPSITNFVHCYENIKYMDNDLIQAICINTKIESLTLMFNSSPNTLGLEGEPQSKLCIIMIIFKLLTAVLMRNQTLKSLKIIDVSKEIKEYLISCSTGYGCPHFGFCKLKEQKLSQCFRQTNIIQFQFPFYMKKYLEKYLIHKKLYSFILKENELSSF
ncbi:hypothetical protein DICPUDRAFT_34742, partial [Dictyostelium purpureum]